MGKPSASGNLLGDSSLQLPRGEAAGWGAGLRWLGPRSSSCSSRAQLGSTAVHPQLSFGVDCPRVVWGQERWALLPRRRCWNPPIPGELTEKGLGSYTGGRVWINQA